MIKKKIAGSLCLTVLFLVGCATESSRSVEVAKVETAETVWQGQRSLIVVGKFDNRSGYMNGIFSDGVDRLGNQSKTILVTHLEQTGRFNILDRSNMDEIKTEANISGKGQSLKGAVYVITGDITEFGRKETGDRALFGILGRGKSQVAYAKVALAVVNVKTSEVVFTTQGAGEYKLSNREILGFGGTASYDSTLNGKVLDLAIRESVNNLVAAIGNKTLNPGNTN